MLGLYEHKTSDVSITNDTKERRCVTSCICITEVLITTFGLLVAFSFLHKHQGKGPLAFVWHNMTLVGLSHFRVALDAFTAMKICRMKIRDEYIPLQL
jgi:hypothetical protein